jgi:iron complex outermembrane receptor protein
VDTARRSSGSKFGVRQATLILTALAAQVLVVGPAAARANKPLAFHVPTKATPDALLDLALQARASLGGELSVCHGVSPEIIGRFTLPVALGRALKGSGCTFALPDPQTIVIRRSGRQPATRPSPIERVFGDTTATVGELVVTAGRRIDLPGRLPYSLSALSGEALRARRIDDNDDLTGEVAGMTVTNLGPGRNKVLLRGISDGAFTGVTQSTVGLYVDDVPITYNAPDPDLRLIDVDRVEIMRGPQGTLYGIGSVGGILRIVTRKPDLETLSSSVSATLSGTVNGGINDDVTSTFNLPVLEGRLAIRGSVYRERLSGYIRDAGLGLNHINEMRRDGGRLSVLGVLDDDWSVDVGIVYQAINNADTQYTLAGLPRLTRLNLLREPHDNDFDEIHATLNGQGSWGTLALSTAKLIHHFDSRYDASAALPTFGAAAGPAAGFEDDKAIEILVGEAVYSTPDRGRFRWLAGAFASDGRTTSDMTLSLLGSSGDPLYSEHRVDRVGEVALYGEATYHLNGQWAVVAGARWFRFDFQTRSGVLQGLRGRDFNGRSHAAGVSPKVSVQFQPVDTVLLYAQVAQGYRAGGFNTGGPIGALFDGAPTHPDREFAPDELWNYEVGAKLGLWDGRLRLRSAAFYAAWNNVQTDQFLRSGIAYAVNVGDASNRGLEVEATWKPTAELEFRASGLLDDPQLTRGRAIFQSQRSGGLPGVPSVSGNLGAEYLRDLGSGLALRVSGRASYVGHSHLSFNAHSRDLQGGYVTGRISAGLEGRGWDVTLFADNPTNTEANTFAFGDPFRRAVGYVTPLRPVTIGVRIGAQF